MHLTDMLTALFGLRQAKQLEFCVRLCLIESENYNKILTKK